MRRVVKSPIFWLGIIIWICGHALMAYADNSLNTAGYYPLWISSFVMVIAGLVVTGVTLSRLLKKV